MQLIDQFSQPVFSRIISIWSSFPIPLDKTGESLVSFGAAYHENLNYYTQRQFTVRMRLLKSGMGESSCVIDWKLSGIENNAPVMGPIEWSI